ncbi:MAG: hypothetical protein ACOYBX_02775 [Mycobacterium sp.]
MVDPRHLGAEILDDARSTRECPACHSTTPAVLFCGHCGAALDAPAGRWQVLLRPQAYAAALREAVYVPRLRSTLFPRLAEAAEKPYGFALVALLICMAVMSALQWNVPAATVSVLGVPLLFLIYAWESGVFREARLGLNVALVLGVIIGLSWWWFTGVLLSQQQGVTTAAAQALENSLVGIGLAITLIGAVLMILPLPFIRMLPAADVDSLDGYVIGAAGALAHMTASYVVWWMPQIVAGVVNAKVTTGTRMLQDTITYGVVDPLTTIALGGMVGVCLWFRPDPASPQRRRARPALILCAVLTAVLYAVVWIVDAEDWDRNVELVINLGLTALSVLTLRIGLQIALLHEKRDAAATGDPVLCVCCEHVVPDMAFCPVCGGSARGSSRGSRRLRRSFPPVPVSAPTAG